LSTSFDIHFRALNFLHLQARSAKTMVLTREVRISNSVLNQIVQHFNHIFNK